MSIGRTHHAAITGIAEDPASKRIADNAPTSLELAGDLALRAANDGGLALADIDGLIVNGIAETEMFVPAALAEYLGVHARFADSVDLGGASPAGMIWRAAAAIRAGMANAVLCVTPGGVWPKSTAMREALGRYGTSSYLPGSPQAEFEIPYGHLGQNAPYAMIAQRYAHVHGYDAEALARLVVQLRHNAGATPGAIFHGKPLTEADVLASPMVAAPLRLLEIVRPVTGGAAVLVTSPDLARRAPHRPVWIAGHGEAVITKSLHSAADMLDPPIAPAAHAAYAMAGITAQDIDVAQLYDCYTITVALILEGAGFCPRGEAMAFLRERDLRWDGDFPINTNGGQLGYGQAGHAAGMYHVTEAALQIMGRAGGRQVTRCDTAFVAGNGGIMSEQVALVLEGE